MAVDNLYRTGTTNDTWRIQQELQWRFNNKQFRVELVRSSASYVLALLIHFKLPNGDDHIVRQDTKWPVGNVDTTLTEETLATITLLLG